ncbi:hypothetical protein MJT46_004194 [Ovis ammon polii x Ovis aries]|nr:hypothetical protein MJT46_004194 [Ovis ammon polii x Ovis aries]
MRGDLCYKCLGIIMSRKVDQETQISGITSCQTRVLCEELIETRELRRRWCGKRWLQSTQVRFASVEGPTEEKERIHFAHFIQMLRVYKAIRRDREIRRETRKAENAGSDRLHGALKSKSDLCELDVFHLPELA